MAEIAAIMGSFHKEQVSMMLAAAHQAAEARGLTISREIWVPGSVEKPLALKRELLRDHIVGAVALGVIEKGETSHGFVMGQAVVNAIIDMQLEFMKPIGLGILGPDIHPSQIPARLEPYARDAVNAVAHMLEIAE